MDIRSIFKGGARVLLCAASLSCLYVEVSAGAHGRGGTAAAPVSPGRGAPALCDETFPSVETYFFRRAYSGHLTYRAEGIDGPATLAVDGTEAEQTFTLTAGGKTFKGRLTSQTTCKYTTVLLTFGDLTPPDPTAPPPPPPKKITLRACKEGSIGLALRSKEPGAFDFAKGILDSGISHTPSGPDEWGRCNGRARLRGNRPL